MNINAQIVSKAEISARKGFTGADWWISEDGTLQVRVERLATYGRTMSLMVHEITEAIICKFQGVTVEQVDKFDTEFERLHPENKGIEAGDADGAPYGKAHMLATACERIVAAEMGIGSCDSWKSYDDELSAT
jgi:hypothetical protein